jgi:hypothetical protein
MTKFFFDYGFFFASPGVRPQSAAKKQISPVVGESIARRTSSNHVP